VKQKAAKSVDNNKGFSIKLYPLLWF
jgi:hypothetical protein